MNLRYVIDEIRKHGTDTQWWRKRFLSRVVSTYFTEINRPDAQPLVTRDWDNVLLLDACRYDLFAEVLAENPLPGTLSKRRSAQSGTPGYLAKNFAGEQFHDVVYVTANPYVNTELPDDTFHAVDPVWQDGWDDEARTVRPEVVRDRALAAAEDYPEKRLIVHFNQPHIPFIGERTIESRGMSAIRETALGNDGPDPASRARTPFEQLGAGEVTHDAVWAAYRSNLEAAWESVRTLLETFEGLTAVTADHGNAMGERTWPFPIRVYGHPLGILIPALTDVPWYTHQHGERKSVTAEQPEGSTAVSDDTEERLRMLGYAE
ncbi:MAG: hypothetical protein ABEI77_02935 [Halorientalis sp.]